MEILGIIDLVMFKKSPASNFDEVCFFCFSFTPCVLGVISKNPFLNRRSLRSIFSPKKVVSFWLLHLGL